MKSTNALQPAAGSRRSSCDARPLKATVETDVLHRGLLFRRTPEASIAPAVCRECDQVVLGP